MISNEGRLNDPSGIFVHLHSIVYHFSAVYIQELKCENKNSMNGIE